MANTLKFGNGQWYGKAGSILAYNDENNNYKPLPFTFTRASSATRVNESGLIESVGSGIPRVDYLNNADGHLLLEPSRTNILLRSEEFDNAYWEKTNSVITNNYTTSPDGNTSADKLVASSSSGQHLIGTSAYVTTLNLTAYVFTVRVKAAEYSKVGIREARNAGSYCCYNLSNGTLIEEGTTTSSIKPLVNGWFEISLPFTTLSLSQSLPQVFVLNDSYTSGNPNSYSYSGDGTSGIYIWGAQLEAGSYATSYIPTSGSSVTRVAEATSQTPPSGVIGQTEGTFFLDFTVNQLDTSAANLFSISDGSTSNRIYIGSILNNKISAAVIASGAGDLISSSFDVVYGGRYKCALSYKLNDIKFYINGSLVGIDTSAIIPVCNRIQNNSGAGTSPFYDSINSIKLYNTALSDSELIALTS